MIEVRSEIDIDASADTVWEVLTDLGRFAEWNPFIREAAGTPAVGARLDVRVTTAIGLRPSFHPVVDVCDRGHELRWHGHYVSPALGSGDHTFHIEPLAEGKVRFVQRELFAGALVRATGPLLRRETQRGFAAMNQALKARAERAQLARTPATEPGHGA